MTTFSRNDYPVSFGFLLVNDFTMISLSSAVEPLRMANRLCADDHYRWRIISSDGSPVAASNGMQLAADSGFADADALQDLDVVIVCGGRRIERNYDRRILRWLKSVGQSGVALGAVCTGSHVLAAAGLLDGYRCSIHWENIASMSDTFPRATVSRAVFTIDRNRYTSSGGTAPVDMMLHIIRAQCGAEVSAGVADQFIYERIRQPDDKQRIPLTHIIGKQSDKLVTAVELMEANIREPISQEDLAEYVGLSRRQLQRLFQRYLHCAPSRYYLRLRLQRARELLRQTNLSLVEISSLGGFVSTSHFSKSYKEFFGHSPSGERRR